jgi:hypothetical protein
MSNGLYNGLSNGLFNGLYSNDIGARLKDPIINLDAGDRRSASSNIVTKWTDLTYNNYNGILINGASFNSSNQGCISCNGGSAYVEIENSDKIKLGAENFTIEYWVKKKVTTVGAVYSGVWGVNKWNSGGNPGQNEWNLVLGDANVDHFQFAIEVGTTIFFTGGYPLTINQWYQAVGIRKGEKLQLYVNGILRQEYTNVFFNQNSIINHSGKKIRIHNSYLDSFHANADVAIFKFYKKALSKEEVRDNFNNLRGRFGI